MIDLAFQTAYQMGLYGYSAKQPAAVSETSKDDFAVAAELKCQEAEIGRASCRERVFITV